MSNYLLVLENLSKIIERWNDKLNGFASHFDSPIWGTAIFLVLLGVAVFFISGMSKK